MQSNVVSDLNLVQSLSVLGVSYTQKLTQSFQTQCYDDPSVHDLSEQVTTEFLQYEKDQRMWLMSDT
jgi:hypothetical protein